MKRFWQMMMVAAVTVGIGTAQSAEPMQARIGVDAGKPGIKVSPELYGIFFEEINLAGDGGIYPELIRNRSFEFSKVQPEFWTLGAGDGAKASMKLETIADGHEYNQTALRVENRGGKSSVVNEGYWGVPVALDAEYNVVVRAKADAEFVKEHGTIRCAIESSDGHKVLCSGEPLTLTEDWKTFNFKIRSSSHAPKARWAITTSNTGTFWLDYVSMKPVDTFNGHGLRNDLMQKLDALKPAFVRFPGGCWVEGDTMAEASRWKKTIGNPAERWTQPNIWGYQSTNGLGYHEYLQMCEDIHADALFVINCGMAHRDHIAMDNIEEYVQDALDAIEYAVGPVTSKWGKIRAENGHPEPFSLKYIQIGNENGGPIYWERYDLFYTRIREKYPDMKLIACQWGGAVTNKKPIEIYDEHYYSSPRFFIDNANKYDSYPRDKHKVYVGEYAVTEQCGQGNLDAAIGEAAFMTGMERNSDVVIMSSYAPLFVNVNHRRWNPDLICFDNVRSYGIPSYYVQKLFSENRGDVIVPTTIEMATPPTPFSGAVGLGSWKTKVEYKDAKVVQGDKVLFESDLDNPPPNANRVRGRWDFGDKTLRQLSDDTDCRYTFGDATWKDCTFSVKAKKIDGEEGFLILFGVTPEGHWAWLNVGGWNNTGTGIQSEAGGQNLHGVRSNFKVEADRWYDIRVEQQGNHVKCFIDDKLITEAEMPPRKSSGVFVVSGLNAAKDELIMKVVNSATVPCDAGFVVAGAAKLGTTVREIVLTSESGLDENTLDYPNKVSPVESSFTISSPEFKRTLPAKSLTILRVPVK
ncbi:MAG: alpha-L-arabinofuranosidase C-terminal domain-containing protein [Thermoguttaceae bacterium]